VTEDRGGLVVVLFKARHEGCGGIVRALHQRLASFLVIVSYEKRGGL
jgi:hypothetical protein